MKKIYHADTNSKIVGVAVLIPVREDFKTRKVIWDKKGHYITSKESVLQGDNNP